MRSSKMCQIRAERGNGGLDRATGVLGGFDRITPPIPSTGPVAQRLEHKFFRVVIFAYDLQLYLLTKGFN